MTHGKDTVILVDEFDYSTIFQNSQVAGPVDMADKSTHGSESKSYEPGLDDGTMNLEAVLHATKGIENFWSTKKSAKLLISRALGGFTIGNAVQTIYGWLQNVDIPSPVGDIVKVTSSIQGDGTGIGYGVSVHDLAEETGAGDGATVDQDAASSNGGYGVLHVTAFSGTNISVVIQDSPNDSTWADVVTFAVATGVTKELVEITGDVDQYIQAEWSGTFSAVTFAVAFGRR